MLRFFFAIFFTLITGPALACSCAGSELPEGALKQASAVFTAHVTVTKKTDKGLAQEFLLKTDRTWKGTVPQTILLDLPNKGCSFWNFEDNKDYLVYAEPSWNKEEPDALNISMCSRTKLLERAQIETQYLDSATSGKDRDLDNALPHFLLSAEDPNMRAEAASLLGEIMMRQEAAPPAITTEALLQAAKDKNPVVRLAVTRTLGFSRMAGVAGVKDALLEALKDEDRQVRAAAVGAFATGNRSDNRVFPALVEALKQAYADPDPDKERQESLLYGFSRALAETAVTEAQRDEAVKLLQELIDNITNPYSKVGPIQHMGFMGERAKGAAPQLLAVLKAAEHEHLKQYTIIALGDIKATETQAEIEPYLKDSNCYITQAVVQSVHKMNEKGFPAFLTEKAMPEMKSRFDKCAAEFTWGLQAIGADAKPMEPFLTEKYNAMSDDDWKKSVLKTLLDMWKQAPTQ